MITKKVQIKNNKYYNNLGFSFKLICKRNIFKRKPDG